MSRRSVQRFDVTTETSSASNTITLVLRGEFDSSVVATFDAAASAVSALAPDQVTVDLEAVTIMDSAAIGALMRLRKAVIADGNRFVLLAPQQFQQRLFAVTGLSHIIQGANQD